jgi:hypothetical protein
MSAPDAEGERIVGAMRTVIGKQCKPARTRSIVAMDVQSDQENAQQIARPGRFDSLLPQPRTTACDLMTEDETAQYLASRMPTAPSARTLRRWRTDTRFKGVGPKPIHNPPAKHVWYARTVVDAWLSSKSMSTAA